MNNNISFSQGQSAKGLALLGSDPIWSSYTRLLYPNNMREALYWSNWLRSHYGDYSSLINRAVSYFVNGLDLTAVSEEDKGELTKYEDILTKDHRILSKLIEIGMDLHFNGNVFLTVAPPINRALACTKCNTIRYLSSLDRGTDYDFKDGEFYASCPSCDSRHKPQRVIDYLDYSSKESLNLINWNPLNIKIDHCVLTKKERIIYTPGADDKNFLADKNMTSALESMPMSILRAIADNKSVAFSPNACLHLKTGSDSINRSYMKGWGQPRWLSSFKYMVILMLLETQLETCAKDFILPTRLLFPSDRTRATGSDPMAGAQYNLPLNAIKSSIANAIDAQSRRKGSWYMVPAPVEQLQLGGDGKALIPIELFEYFKGGMMDSQCIPQEFSKSTLFATANAQPMSLRMFEHTWIHEVEQLDSFLDWYLEKCHQILEWPALNGVLARPSVQNDPSRMQIMQQYMAQGVVSKGTALRSLGIDPIKEAALVQEEQIEDANRQAELNKKLGITDFTRSVTGMTVQNAMGAAQQAQQGGDPAAQEQQGAAPAPQGGGGAPVSGYIQQPNMTGDPVMDIQNLASMRPNADVPVDQIQVDAQMAAQIIAQTPVGAQRNQLYSMIKQGNDTLHAMVKEMVDQLEQQARNQGLAQSRGQA